MTYDRLWLRLWRRRAALRTIALAVNGRRFYTAVKVLRGPLHAPSAWSLAVPP